MTEQAGRSWGFWTRLKLRILADYLSAFVRAASNPSERIYLDAFAGEGTGLDRLTGEKFDGSPRIALEVGIRASPAFASSSGGVGRPSSKPAFDPTTRAGTSPLLREIAT